RRRRNRYCSRSPTGPRRKRSASGARTASRDRSMTKEQINAVLESVRSWPQEDQEELAEFAREIEARRAGLYRLSKTEREGVERGFKAMREGRFASDERITEIFQKARPSRT